MASVPKALAIALRRHGLMARRGSWIRPVWCVSGIARSEGSEELALSHVAWEGDDDWEADFHLYASPPPGIDDLSIRWLLGTEQKIDDPDIALRLVDDPIDDGAVRIHHDQIITVLLRCKGVIAGPNDPLAWDAWRAGQRVFASANGDHVTPSMTDPSAWAGCVPPFMAVCEEFWTTWDGLSPVCTAENLIRTRELTSLRNASSSLAWDVIRRRALKLVRQPRAFLKDSSWRILRRLGERR